MHNYRVDTVVSPIVGEGETLQFLISTINDDFTAEKIRSEALDALQTLNKTGPDRFMHIDNPVEILGDVPLPAFPPIRDDRRTKTWVVHAPAGL